MPWFSILNKDYSPRPAWKAFKTWRDQDRAQAASRQRSASGPSGPPVTPASEPVAMVGASADGQPVAAQAVSEQPLTDPPAFPTPTAIPIPTFVPAPTFTPITFPSATTEPTATPSTPTATVAVPDVVPTATYPVPDDATATPTTRVRVTGTDGTGVNLRARPGQAADSLGVLPDGTLLDIVGDDVIAGERTWRNVRTQQGRTGWVNAQYLSP